MLKTFKIILVASLISCSGNKNRIYETHQTIEKGIWEREDIKSFNIEIEDISTHYNFYYTIRNTIEYPYYNLYLRYELLSEEGDTIASKLQHMNLFDEKTGEPLGNKKFFSGGSMGDLFDHQILSLSNVKVPKTGSYTFKVKQYMRDGRSIPGLFAIGCRVDKAQN